MTDPAPTTLPDGLSQVLRLADLRQRKPTRFEITPEAQVCAALAQMLDLSELRKLRFTGKLSPLPGKDWLLEAKLGATLVQPCSITLAPVSTRVEEDVRRHYSDQLEPPNLEDGAEIEMAEDDTLEPLPASIDLGEVLLEALALAIPPFPRAKGVGLGEVRTAPDGIDPLDDGALKPFAGLAGLRDKLEGKGE